MGTIADEVVDRLDDLSPGRQRIFADAQRRAKWDCFYLGMAEYVATASKDPSTKVGSVIVRPTNTVASVGYNGFPRGLSDAPELYEDRETKYSRVVHAEMNAILNAHGPVDGFTLYNTFPPCDRCAVFVVQAGIKRVVTRAVPVEAADRWASSLAKTAAIFAEAGVEMVVIPRQD
jgi:dCMP deaminase